MIAETYANVNIPCKQQIILSGKPHSNLLHLGPPCRFTNEPLTTADYKIFRYRYGPQPAELGGQRALDFVLDNTTLRDFNRDLLMDIKLLAVRKPKQ